MPSPRELVLALTERLDVQAKCINDLEQRVTELEKRPATDPWDEPIDAEIVVEADVDDDRIDVTIAPPTGKQRAMRLEMLNRGQIGLEHLNGLGLEAATEAYIQGGPHWLYFYDREFLLQLPFGTRQLMVQDLALVSDEDALEFGRDVLMDRGEQDQANTIPLAVSE